MRARHHLRRSVTAGLTALLLTGCIGSYRVAPVAPGTMTDLGPMVDDPEAGLVSVAPGLRLGDYPVILVGTVKVSDSEIKDDEDRHLAGLMPTLFQTELIARLRAAGLFDRVVNLAEGGTAPANTRALRLDGVITRLGAGNRALRYMVGFGAGASKAQIETRLVDAESGRLVVATADRREASFGIFGGDSEEHLREAVSDMARDYARMLSRLRPAVAGAGFAPGSGSVPLGGRWRAKTGGVLDITHRGGGLQWDYEYSAGSYGIQRANGSGSVKGDDVSLVGRLVAGTPIGRSFTFTLKHQGNRLVGTMAGVNNTPHNIEFERAR